MARTVTETVHVTIGPDRESGEGGTCWIVDRESGGKIETLTIGGSPRLPHDRESPRTWFAYARRHLRGQLGGRPQWGDAIVKPYGLSHGPQHAPDGIAIRVPVRREVS